MLHLQAFRGSAAAGPRRPGARGFTLIELLVAMAILASLAAILIPVVGRARVAAKVASTKYLLEQICAGIDRFAEDWGTYPPDRIPAGTSLKYFDERGAPPGPASYAASTDIATSAESLYYCLANPYVTGKHPYLDPQAAKQCLDGNHNGIPELVDSWEQPFSYNRKPFGDYLLPDIFYTSSEGPPTVKIPTPLTAFDDGGSPTHNTNSYDLWSPGPGGLSAGKGVSKPITNWQ